MYFEQLVQLENGWKHSFSSDQAHFNPAEGCPGNSAPGIQSGSPGGQEDGETCSYVQHKHLLRMLRLSLWLTRQGRMREDVFSQTRKSSCSHNNNICAGFAVYEAFSNRHFVWSSDPLWEKHRANIMIYIFRDNFPRLPNISQMVSGKDNIVIWCQVTLWSPRKISVLTLMGRLAMKAWNPSRKPKSRQLFGRIE